MSYQNKGYAITKEISNGFIITATYKQINRENSPEIHAVSLEINHISTDWKDKITDMVFSAPPKIIRHQLDQYIQAQSAQGYYAPYIQRYEHMLKCYNRGYELYETEVEKEEHVQRG